MNLNNCNILIIIINNLIFAVTNYDGFQFKSGIILIDKFQ